MTTKQRIARSNKVSVYRGLGHGGWVAEVRGLFDERCGYYDWVVLGVYGTREAAEAAIADEMGW